MKHKIIFNEGCVNKKVKCSTRGEGVLIRWSNTKSLPILVEFESGLLSTFTACGRSSVSDENPTLSLKPRERFKYKVGFVPLIFRSTATWCWVGESVEDVVNKSKMRQVIAYQAIKNSPYLSVANGLSCDKSIKVFTWRYAMALSKEEIKIKDKNNLKGL